MVREYRAKYQAIDEILKANPKIINLAHRDLAGKLSESQKGRACKYTSEQIMRALAVMFIEGDSYRDVVIRIESSDFLRNFLGLGIKPMMDYSFLSKAFGCLSPKSWQTINERLASYALEQEHISSEKLRVDTTTVETNINYPTDSSLLWDSYRTLVRLLRQIRDEYPRTCRDNRFHDRRVKRLSLFIARNVKSAAKRTQRRVKTKYRKLIDAVTRVLEVSEEVVRIMGETHLSVQGLRHFQPLVERVIDQAERRLFQQEKVPADEKLYSLFEEHTELLIRGKARKPVEFGHMILIAQTKEKFISQYLVMEKRIPDKDLLDEAVNSHKDFFDAAPRVLAADKGFYESMKELKKLEEEI